MATFGRSGDSSAKTRPGSGTGSPAGSVSNRGRSEHGADLTRPKAMSGGRERSDIKQIQGERRSLSRSKQISSPTQNGQSERRRTPTSKARVPHKPSDRLNPRTIDPFNDKTPKSLFEAAYSNGCIPCRLAHGSVKHKLQWDTRPENLNFDPILVTLAEGLKETRHPYTFVAREGFKEMLMVEDAEERTRPILPKLIPPIRAALGAADQSVFQASLHALIQLSNVVGPALNPYLKSILPQVAKKSLDKNFKEQIIHTLQELEYNGGKECLPIIKARIPTYSSIHR